MKIKNTKTPPTSLSFRFPPQLRGTKGGAGFTLVELLVVITIIAILATLSFVSFQGFTRDARDATRLGQIDQIQKGLESYAIDNAVYPESNNPVSITASGTIISYQGTFSDTQSKLINLSPPPLDPLDKTEYTYLTTASKDKYQLLAFMEGKEYKQTAFINNASLTLPLSLMEGNTAYAADYTNRYIRTKGSNLGIILDSTNQPITGTGFDILTGATLSNQYKIVYKDKEIKQGTGSIILKQLLVGDELGSGLVAYWTFNENNFDKVLDCTGLGNDGFFTGSVKPTYTGAILGTGIYFSGSGGYIGTNNLIGKPNFTVSFYFKHIINIDWNGAIFTNIGKVKQIPNAALYNGYRAIITPIDSNILFSSFSKDENDMGYESKNIITGKKIGELDGFLYYTFTLSGKDSCIYVNGIKNKCVFLESTPFSINPILWFGGNYDTKQTVSIKGIIDEVRIYNRALSSDEVMTLYEKTK